MKRMVFTLLVTIGVSVSAMTVQAQTSPQPAAPDLTAVIQSLTPEATGPVVRSMKSAGNMPFTSDQYIPDGFDFPAFSFDVGFSEGGHLLTTAGMTTLRTLATALNDPQLAGTRFQVGAHVPQNNGLDAMPVSSRRAATVVEHLVAFYGVSPDRLVPLGYGNTKLVDPTTPGNPANERIELINVTSLN